MSADAGAVQLATVMTRIAITCEIGFKPHMIVLPRLPPGRKRKLRFAWSALSLRQCGVDSINKPPGFSPLNRKIPSITLKVKFTVG
jgi:hypothetical protein